MDNLTLIIKSPGIQIELYPLRSDGQHQSIPAKIARKGEVGYSLTELDPAVVRCIVENAGAVKEWLDSQPPAT